MKRYYFLVLMLIASIMTFTFTACGGDDDDNGNSGGDNTTTTFNIVGTWRAYYQSNGIQVYDLVTFNADHTGYVIEEVGNGTDYKNPITWTQTGNVIQVKLDGNYVITWTIMQIIDNNTVIISDGKRNYNVVRDGTGGGTSSSNFVSKGGGSLTVAQLQGTWQVYHVEYYDVVNGQVYSQSYDIYPNDQSEGMTTCYRYEFYADYTYKRTEYYNGDWIAPRNYSYRETGGRIYLPEGGSPAPEYCMVTANKTRSDEIVITTHYTDTDNDEYAEYLLKRVENGGGSGGTVVNDTINNPMSVADIYDIVVAMPSDEVSVYPYCAKGKVCSIKYPFSAEYGTSVFNISDTGYTGSKEFTVYQTYYKALGQKWVDGNPQIAVGDEVVVYGKVVNYRGTTPEFADKQSYIVTINGR